MVAFQTPPPTSVLLAGELPPGYRCVPSSAAAPLPEDIQAAAAHSDACRWLPPGDAPRDAPLAVDAAVTTFARRTNAIQALTSAPKLPVGMTVRPLFPPRIGDDTAAVRADISERGLRYVLYRVDVQVGRRLASVAATWRWPAGSPSWVYDRARRLAERLTEAD